MEKNDLYTELWRACAGPLVEVPSRGERVYYFPQGHMEQVRLRVYIPFMFTVVMILVFVIFIFMMFLQLRASTNQELDQHIPKFNLPPKILCHVVHVQLMVTPAFRLRLLFSVFVFVFKSIICSPLFPMLLIGRTRNG